MDKGASATEEVQCSPKDTTKLQVCPNKTPEVSQCPDRERPHRLVKIPSYLQDYYALEHQSTNCFLIL